LTQIARSTPGVDAVVVLEVAVLDRLQAGDQQFGHFLDAHQAALFLLLPYSVAMRAGSSRADLIDRLARHVAHAGDARPPPTWTSTRLGPTMAVDIGNRGSRSASARRCAGRCPGARPRRRRDRTPHRARS
jgi:hypothetical protein